jgi:hypothetical protein
MARTVYYQRFVSGLQDAMKIHCSFPNSLYQMTRARVLVNIYWETRIRVWVSRQVIIGGKYVGGVLCPGYRML